MKKFLLSHAVFFGAFAGLAFFGAGEFFSMAIRQMIEPSFSTISFDLGVMFWAFIKSVIIGVPVGQSCGAATREWVLGNRMGAKSICRSAGWCIVCLFTVFFALVVSGLIDFFSDPMVTSRFQRIAGFYFASFPLQIGIFLLAASHFLPDESSKTTQITENLRL